MCLELCFVCCSVGIDKQFLAAPVKSAVDKFQLLPEFLKVIFNECGEMMNCEGNCYTIVRVLLVFFFFF